MRNLYALFLLLFIVASVSGQTERTLLKGNVLLEDISISDVHVVNTDTNIGTITNEKGVFEIPTKIGDSIRFSHVNLKDKIIIISKDIILEDEFTIQLTEKTYSLDEITLQKPRSIFYIDPEIMPNNGPKVNATTLNLPYANTTVEKDEDIYKIQSGAVVSLDNLINALNGNTKRKKLLKKMSAEDAQLSKIRKHYTDSFFVIDLKIKPAYINPFLNYCIDENIIHLFKTNNQIKLTKVFLQESNHFPYKIENEDLFLTKIN